MAALVRGLMDYCQIPSEQVSFLKWNGANGQEEEYSAGEGAKQFTLMGAMVEDDSTGEWRLGIRLALTPQSSLQAHWILMVFYVSDSDGTTTVRPSLGSKPRPVNLSDERESSQFYEEIVADIKGAISNPRAASAASKIGFVIN